MQAISNPLHIKLINPSTTPTIINSPTQVYVKSLVPNAPVHLNNAPVTKETLVDHKGVLMIGTCMFRFDYHDGAMPGTPLKDGNGTTTPKQVLIHTHTHSIN